MAIKVPRAGTLASRGELDRFLREARSVAQLRHPFIVSVHDVGQAQDVPYLVSEFVEGVTLADQLSARRPAPREAAELVARLADALQYAHEMGVVHRDVKPANVLLSADGTPRLMDFGLAKRDAGDVTVTIDGQILGTPAYMSPEQARGEAHRVDGRSDVYSLGVILYQLLTGELPFRGTTRMLLHQVLHEEPRRPRSLHDKIPRDLETVCLKAMAKEPARRYPTARDLADDLRRFLTSEPIRARPVSAAERAWIWARRRPAAAALTLMSGVAVLALCGLVTGAFYNLRLQEARERAEAAQQVEAVARREEGRQRQVAQAAVAEAKQYQYFHHIALAHAGWRDGNMGQVERLLEACPADRRGWEWDYLKRLCHADLMTLRGHSGEVTSVAFSPDGTRLASAGVDQTIKLWDAATGQLLHTFIGHKNDVARVCFSPDGAQLASASDDQTVKVWDAATGQPIRTLTGHTDVVAAVAFSPDGRRLVSAGYDRSVRIWDATTFQVLRTFPKRHDHWIFGVAVSPDGRRVATASHDTRAKIWDAATGSVLHTLRGHVGLVSNVAFSPSGARLASAGFEGTVKVWDATTGREVFALRGHTSAVYDVAFSPDGTRLASAGADQSVRVWDAATGQAIAALRGHTSIVSAVAFSPDGRRLASAGRDGTVKLWDTSIPQEAVSLKGHTDDVTSVAFHSDGSRIASASLDRTVRVWDVKTGGLIAALKGHAAGVRAVSFHPAGTRLASAGSDNALKIWEVATGRVIQTLKSHTSWISSLAFSPDGDRLVSGSWDRTVKIWNAETGQVMHTLTGHTAGLRCVAFSPDGHRVASAGDDQVLKIWDAVTGQIIYSLQGHKHWMRCLAFSPDGSRLATGSRDGTVKLWDAATGQEVGTLGNDVQVLAVTFSPDGRRLVLAGDDHVVKVWDVTAGQPALTLTGHTGAVYGLAFSPDGTRLASGSMDQSIRLWDARPWTTETAGEREALGLLAFLFGKPLCKADVIEYVRNSPTIASQVGQQALTLAESYREETDPERYHQAAWATVRQPYLNGLQYHFALRQAETACRLAPEQGRYLTALGTAQYRAGQYREALKTLTKADPLNRSGPADLAFLALTQHQLGQTVHAQATLARLREVLQQDRWAKDEEARGFLREAEAVMAAKAADSEK